MRPASVLLKKAPLVGAFFVLGAWLGSAHAEFCGAPPDAQLVKVRHVHDGDTLVLADNTRVRLIGINTPEIATGSKPAEPVALRARDHLRRLLFQSGNKARMLAGEQDTDRHGRSLAHLWLPDGSSLTANLLENGLGWYVAIPPNVRYIGCYQASESIARKKNLGVWDAPGHAPQDAARLKLRDSGFHVVRGRITRVKRGGNAIWINLQGRFAVRIPDNSIHRFSPPPDESWVGRSLEVRGWLYQAKGELRVNAGHPAAIRLIDAGQNANPTP